MSEAKRGWHVTFDDGDVDLAMIERQVSLNEQLAAMMNGEGEPRSLSGIDIRKKPVFVSDLSREGRFP